MSKQIPDARMPADDLIALATDAAALMDFETLTDCWRILRARPRTRPVRRLEEAVSEYEAAPVEWLDLARSVCSRFHRTARGNHHLYAVLLDGFVAKGRFGLYIGESRYIPAMRLTQHLTGIRASGVVFRRGVTLLPSLVAHLNPLARQEAKELEAELARALRAVGIETRGGH
jgi:hypothetical protein